MGEVAVDLLPPVHQARQPIDIEALLQWAIQQSGRLPWRGVSARELMYDYGYTCIPKGTPRCYRSSGTLLSRPIDDDAALVIAAVMALDGEVAAIVIANAREGRRPDYAGEPRRVPVTRRHRKKHRRVVTGFKLVMPDEGAICAARAAYRQWHAALGSLARTLSGQLDAWQINGFVAAAEPWASGFKEDA